MSSDEVQQLRRNTENWSIADLARGRRQGPLAWMVVDLALCTGLRVVEISALTLHDVDIKRSCLTVTRVKKKVRKPETLMIDSDLTKHLQVFIDHQRKASESDSLWIGNRGAISYQGLQLIWKKAVKLAGLTLDGKARYSIHCARHTLATHLLKKTGNLRQVQLQLGHSSPVVTANMYAHVTAEDMQAGVEKLYGQ
jgi:integrase